MHASTLAMASAMLCLCSGLEAGGDGTLKAPLVLSAPDPIGLCPGDFNRDGKQDLAVVSGTSQVSILIQDSGSRCGWRKGSYQAGLGLFAILSGDFDGDGVDDVALTDPASQAYCMKSLGDGTFGPAVALPASLYPRASSAGDFDGDGNLDLALANHDALNVSIYLGEGTGRFNLNKTYPAGGEPHGVQTFDSDGNGVWDLAVGLSEKGVQVLNGKGDGTFVFRPAITALGCARGFSSQDFNRDGLEDLVVNCFAQSTVATTMPGGSFQITMDKITASSTAVVDLDGDGKVDLTTTSYGSSEVSVYPGTGDGKFGDPLSFQSTGLNPYAVVAADLDADGSPDVVTADRRSASLTVLWGTKEGGHFQSCRTLASLQSVKSVAVGDLDRNGAADLFVCRLNQPQVDVFLGSRGPQISITTANVYHSLETPDLNGDGIPDLAGVQLSQGLLLTAILDDSGKVRSEASRFAGTMPSRVLLGQVDGDGNLDLLVPCGAPGELSIFMGRGEGDFAEAAVVPSVSRVKDGAVGDFDGDGRSDLAVIATEELAVQFGEESGFSEPIRIERNEASRFSDPSIADLDGDSHADLIVLEAQVTGGVCIFAGLGDGQFAATKHWKPEVVPSELHLADLDGDGYLDATVLSKNGQAVSIIFNREGSGFPPVLTYRVQPSPLGHRIADMDGDGALDVMSFSASSAVLLRGQPIATGNPRFVRGDSEGDGVIGITDAILIIGRLFLAGDALPCEDAADADDDGELSLSDAIAILDRLFLGGAPLPPPGPGCGEDPTTDALPDCPNSCPKN